jgi:hypothetical protein
LACRPGSVRPLSRAGGHPSRAAVAGRLVRSTRELGRAALERSRRPRAALRREGPYDLAPGGVYRAAAVTYDAGGLLHHRFTLTASRRAPGAGPAAVCFLWHCPADHPGSALPTTLPCGARTFLGDPGEPEPTRPPGQLARRSPDSSPRTLPAAPPARTRCPSPHDANSHVVPQLPSGRQLRDYVVVACRGPTTTPGLRCRHRRGRPRRLAVPAPPAARIQVSGVVQGTDERRAVVEAIKLA